MSREVESGMSREVESGISDAKNQFWPLSFILCNN
jgi:hypothetical protein